MTGAPKFDLNNSIMRFKVPQRNVPSSPAFSMHADGTQKRLLVVTMHPFSTACLGDGKTENQNVHSPILYDSCNFDFLLDEDLKPRSLLFRSSRQRLSGWCLTVPYTRAIPTGQPQTLVGRLAYRSSELMMNGCEVFVIAQAPL